MKKLLIVSIIAMVALTGCGYEKGEILLGNNFTVKEVLTNNNNNDAEKVYVVIDKKSGVNYYWIASGQGRSLTPIYNKDGKVVIDKVE